MTAPDPLTASAIDLRNFWDGGLAWFASHYLQILIAIGAGVVIVAILSGVRSIGMRLCRADRGHADWRMTLGRVLAITHLWFMIAFAAKLVDGYAMPPATVTALINVGFTIAAALQMAIWARELTLGLIERRAGGDADTGTLGSAMGIIRLLVTCVLFAIAAVVILDNLGVNVTGLIAGLGIGGIAIGLAAKGIFDDLFSALSIIFDKPFRRGDIVKWENTVGTVETIGLKSTRLRSAGGDEVVISNTNLLNKELHNLARAERRRHTLSFGLVYQTPPETCARIPDMLRAIVEAREGCAFVRCGFANFGASSLDYDLLFDARSDIFDQSRHDIGLAILRAFEEAGVAFAYPTQTSFTADPEGRLILPYPAFPAGKAEI